MELSLINNLAPTPSARIPMGDHREVFSAGVTGVLHFSSSGPSALYHEPTSYAGLIMQKEMHTRSKCMAM
jgi:hypothetical protein